MIYVKNRRPLSCSKCSETGKEVDATIRRYYCPVRSRRKILCVQMMIKWAIIERMLWIWMMFSIVSFRSNLIRRKIVLLLIHIDNQTYHPIFVFSSQYKKQAIRTWIACTHHHRRKYSTHRVPLKMSPIATAIQWHRTVRSSVIRPPGKPTYGRRNPTVCQHCSHQTTSISPCLATPMVSPNC